ncbi:phosphatase PAP2 family protein [Nitratireductor pacificus]|uniref:PA-phosphatase-like phosphoesterase n=1 Tax=Nitratireductor pacificus pht-3B TaxID=391937 RepID=K2LI49_9HYPH|nr:phosphatase PAP2 family protein [Nitratireductor pacificus]EKF17429.1 PA-phosphatase-like phosphoesterase [Nitratireductor pacificus pht-3B]
MKTFARRVGRRRQVLAPALLLLVLALGSFAFLAIADEVAEGEIRAFDERLLLSMRNPADPADPIGPPWLEEMALEVTAVGGYPLIVLSLAVVAGLLVVTRRFGAALYAVLSVGSGALVSHFLKHFYDRPRPDIVAHLDVIHTASFPSGHAMVTTVAYLTLAALVMRFFEDWRVRAYVLCVAVLVALLVGISRVYLGVHWPSDVAAGWALGAAWASLTWLVVTLLALYRNSGGGAGAGNQLREGAPEAMENP